MLRKFGINKDFDKKKTIPLNRSSRPTSSRLDRKQSPSPVILNRTRNENINLTKSHNAASSRTDFATFALQTTQRQLQRKQAQQQLQLQNNQASTTNLK